MLRRERVASNIYTERVVQFGEGNFLRAFVDSTIHNMNREFDFDSGVVVVQPIEFGMVDELNRQSGLYNLILKGIYNKEAVRTVELIDAITRGVNPYINYDEYIALSRQDEIRFVISNTTEAGIVFDPNCKLDDTPPKSFPAKLTQMLYSRYNYFGGATDKGLIVIPCELIEDNGDKLLESIISYIEMWKLGDDFLSWIKSYNYFANTLVDRIVPGYPKDRVGEIESELGYCDNLVVEGEIFKLWVISGDKIIDDEFCSICNSEDVIFTDSIKPYRDRKVTLLNAPHTLLSPIAYLSGLDTVRSAVEDCDIKAYIDKVIFEELIPTLDLPEDELMTFANDVLDRFRNPFVDHYVTSITLNSFAKYNARVVPALLKYIEKERSLPKALIFGLAAIAIYYRGGERGADIITPNDSEQVKERLKELWDTNLTDSVAEGVLSLEGVWSVDLLTISGVKDELKRAIDSIDKFGMREACREVL